MYWFFSIAVAAIAGALLMVTMSAIFGRGEELPPVSAGLAKQRHWDYIHTSEITSQSIGDVAFSQSLRGYTPAEVDAYLERVAQRVSQLEEELGKYKEVS